MLFNIINEGRRNEVETKNLLQLLENNLDDRKRGITFIGVKNDQHITYSELYQKSLNISGYLQKKGLKPGDEVLIQTNNVNIFTFMFWACIFGGFIPVPLTAGNTSEHKTKLLKVWKKLNNPYLFIDQMSKRTLNGLSDSQNDVKAIDHIMRNTINYEEADNFKEPGKKNFAAPEDIAFIQFSSGSTGDPKGVILTHENVLTNLEGIVDADPCRFENDQFFSWMPLTHDLGLIGFHLVPLAAKINHYLMPTNMFIRSPFVWLKKAQQYQATILSSPNFGYKYFLDRFKQEDKEGLDLSCIRKIVNGAEPISYDLSKQFLETLQPYDLKQDVMVPSYGMAEASVGITFPVGHSGLFPIYVDRSSLTGNSYINEFSFPNRKTAVFVNLGKAIKGTMVRICDEDGYDLGQNKIGKVQIKGKNVTSAYYNDQEKTDKAITKDGWLITGDLGFLKNDELIITGREKDVIFVNGQNYYLHDIERVAENTEGIELGKIAVCGSFNEKLEKEEVVAFVLHRGSLEEFALLASQLKKHISRELAINIASVLPVKYIPKTTSGKIRRFVLAQQYEDGEFAALKQSVDELLGERMTSRLIVVPENDMEEKLVQFFKKILGTNQVSIHDHFFELGGNSLKAGQLLGFIQREYKVDISFGELFSFPTVRKLAGFIQNTERKSEIPIVPLAKERNYYPITPMQQKIYFMQHYQGIGTTYNVSAALKVEGKIDVEKMQSAFQLLVDRHHSLRTNFVTRNGEIQQIVHKSLLVNIEFIPSKDYMDGEFIRSFNLESGPLIRMGIYEVKADEFILIFDTHHIVADRISMNLLLRDFFQLYEGKVLDELPVQYKDFTLWQEKRKEEIRYTEMENYWKDILSGDLPVLEFPMDFVRGNIQSFQGDKLSFSVDGPLLQDLRMLANETDTTLYMVLISAYQVLLSKYTGQEDIIVGTPVSGRYHTDLEKIIGMFVNTLPIRSFPESAKSFLSFLNEMKDQVIDTLKYQDYSVEELFNQLLFTKDPSRNPLFDTVFVMQNMDQDLLAIEGMKIEEVPVYSKHAKFDITLEAIETADCIHFHVEFCSKLFKHDTVKRLMEHYKTVLGEISKHPNQLISDITILSEKEKARVLYHFNDTVRGYPDHKTIHQLFEEQAGKSPEAVALLFKNEKMTYDELNAKADKVAFYLFQNGVGSGDYVGVLLNRGFEMVIGILGILKAGGAYVPLDPSLPKDRLDYIINSLKIKALVINETQKTRADDFVKDHDHLHLLVDPFRMQHLERDEKPPVLVTSSENAYVIFTSGSTGTPNGVRVKHQPVVNLIDFINHEFRIGPSDRVLFLTSLSFDLSVYDIFGMLSAGGSIRIVAEEELRNPFMLLERMTNEPITLWDSAPAAFGQIVPFLNNVNMANSTLRYVFLSGDWIPLATPQILSEAFPSAKLISLGGATEATVWSNFYPVDRVLPEWKSIPYGKPIQNAQYYILNQHLQPCPVGVPGELYIGGECLAEGYINSPELNNARFLSNPFIDSPSARMYKTGDKAKWHEDGNIEFLGRLDFQVKIRGYRIELGEIQSALLKHSDIKEAYVLARENSQGHNDLCAYILSEAKLLPSVLRDFLAEKIPEYMIPSYFVVLDSLPVTANGKLDRKALPKPDTLIDLGQQYVAPKNYTEEILVSIWEELLGIERIGVNDNFFALGGDSIKAIQAAARLDKYNLQMEINDLFRFPTIAAISGHIKKNTRDIDQGMIEGAVNLTPVQRWFFAQEFEENHHFNQAFLLHSKYGFDTAKVKLVFDRILEHHDSLRIGIVETNEGTRLFNYGLSIKAPKVTVYDFTQEVESEVLISREAELIQKEISLSHPPLMKLAQFNTKDGAYLLIVIHHLIVDGVSWRILFEDFVNGYKSAVLDQEITFPPKMDSFQAWSRQLKIYSESTALEKEVQYWSQIAHFKGHSLPRDFQSSRNNNNSTKTVRFHLDETDSENLLKKSGKAFNTNVETILLTALSLSILDWTQHSEILVHLEGHGRENITDDLKIDRTIGWFTSMYPILLKTDPHKGIGYQIKEVKELLSKVPNGGIGYGVLRYGSHSDHFADVQPEINFNYLGQFHHELDGNVITISDLPIGSAVSPNANRPFSLNLNCYVKQDQFVMMLDYSDNEFSDQTMDWLTNRYKKHLLELIDYCMHIEPELTPSDLTFNEFGIDELEDFIKEVSIGLVDEE